MEIMFQFLHHNKCKHTKEIVDQCGDSPKLTRKEVVSGVFLTYT